MSFFWWPFQTSGSLILQIILHKNHVLFLLHTIKLVCKSHVKVTCSREKFLYARATPSWKLRFTLVLIISILHINMAESNFSIDHNLIMESEGSFIIDVNELDFNDEGLSDIQLIGLEVGNNSANIAGNIEADDTVSDNDLVLREFIANNRSKSCYIGMFKTIRKFT